MAETKPPPSIVPPEQPQEKQPKQVKPHLKKGKKPKKAPDPSRPKGGRLALWRDSNIALAKKISPLGLTENEIANLFKVERVKIWEWKIAYPAFGNAIKMGKQIADQRVERRLYERAVGYDYEYEKAFVIDGEIVKVTLKAHEPPEVAACIFWLKNRCPEIWRDKVEYQHNHQFNFAGVMPTREEWLEKYGSELTPILIEDQKVEE